MIVTVELSNYLRAFLSVCSYTLVRYCSCLYNCGIPKRILSYLWYETGFREILNMGRSRSAAPLSTLKGQCHEIFDLCFFPSITSTQAPDSYTKVISIMVSNSRRYSNRKLENRDSAVSLSPRSQKNLFRHHTIFIKFVNILNRNVDLNIFFTWLFL